jgi:hypothetical protein
VAIIAACYIQDAPARRGLRLAQLALAAAAAGPFLKPLLLPFLPFAGMSAFKSESILTAGGRSPG